MISKSVRDSGMNKRNRLSVLFNRNMIILYLILLAALLVRIIGLDWYLPHTYELDEYYTIRKSLEILKHSSLDPGSFMWPSLYFYIQAIGYGLYYLWRVLIESIQSLPLQSLMNNLTQTEIFLVGRFTTVLYGVGTVLLVYFIGQRMYSRKVGLLSSLFLAFTLLHVRYSRLIRPDVPMAFFITLSFLCTYLIYERGKVRDYLLATIFAGFSIATKYTGAVLIVPIFLAHLFRGLKEKKTLFSIFFNKKVLLILLFIAGGFFIAFPYGLLRPHYLFITIKGWLRGLNKVTANNQGEMSSWLYYIMGALNYGMGQPLEIFSLAAVVYAVFRHRKKDILLISFPLVYYLIMGSFLRHFGRYILPVVPFLVIAAAMFLVEIASKISSLKPRQNFIIVGLTLAIILFPGIRVIRYVELMTEKGTGLQAEEWIEKNISREKKIVCETYSPPLSGYTKLGGGPGFKVGHHPLDYYKKERFDYIIINNFSYDRYLNTRLKRFEGFKRNYEEIEAKCELVKQFDPPPFSPYNPNPVIKIYRIKYEQP